MINIFNIKTCHISALLLFLPGLLLANAPVLIQLYSVSTKPFVSVPANVVPCYLDIAGRELQSINNALVQNPHVTAHDLVRRHPSDFKRIAHSTVCQFQAARLGLIKLPAIVFNRQTVIYGVFNVASAINRYQQSEEGRS